MVAVSVMACLGRRESAVLVGIQGREGTQERLGHRVFRVPPVESKVRSVLRDRQECLVRKVSKVSRARRDRLVILVLLVRQDREASEDAEVRRATRVMMEPTALLEHEDDVDRKVTLVTPDL